VSKNTKDYEILQIAKLYDSFSITLFFL